jgi:3-polyprenyl-4-hydroxybenzoate decarboxylase
MGFDATRKFPEEAGEEVVRHWPAELAFDEPTAAKVDRRWAEYGL